MKDRGFLYAVRKCSIVYKAPARYADTILSDASLVKMTTVQLIFRQTIINKNTKELLVEADVSLVSLNQNFKPAAIPEDIKTKRRYPRACPWHFYNSLKFKLRLT